MNEFSKDELVKISQAINAHYGTEDEVVEDYKVARTHESTDDFKNGLGGTIDRDAEQGEGWTADLKSQHQYKAGEPRVDLLIVDLGDVRAVVEV